jgi:hypothetical protein
MSNLKSFQKFLIDNGLIFEINRKVLHPLGLAMIVDIDRNNKRKLSITGLAETEDEDGFIYDEEAFTIGTEKYQKFLDRGGQDRLDARKAKYGFIEQDKVDV